MSETSEGGSGGRLIDRLDRIIRQARRAVAAHSPPAIRRGWMACGAAINRRLPAGLLGRSLLIIVLPMMILLTVLTGVFMDRHWMLVTTRLSDGVVRNIAVLIDIAEAPLDDPGRSVLIAASSEDMGIKVRLLASGDLGTSDLGSVDLVHRTLAEAIRARINRSYTIRSRNRGEDVEIRLPITGGTLSAQFPRGLAYASNWHFFLVWMVSTALLLVLISVIFLRNQIRPIQQLANAADAFGRGQPAPDFSPRGAREVRKAAHAFIGMRRRIERQIEQRTTMLAGVSHDLRTILTRFKLELALQAESEETEAMRADVAEMEAMLKAYLDFARGDSDETAQRVDVGGLVAASVRGFEPSVVRIATDVPADAWVTARPTAFRRMVDNLVGNAVRYGRGGVWIRVEQREGWLSIIVDDNGPGIPEDEREAVFRPFYRRDEARNQDIPGTGLGLAIARDVARGHGGEISLEDSPRGGLRAVVRLPG